MDTNQQDRIDQYILDQMPEAERRAFEAGLEKDPELAAEVLLQQQAVKAIRIAALRQQLGAAGERYRERAAGPARKINTRRILSVAAALLVLLSFIAIWKPWVQKQDDLYRQFYEADPGLPTLMGGKATTLAEAMVEYKQAHYDIAIPMFRELQQNGISGDTATFFLGASLQAEGEQEKALEQFRKVGPQSPGLRQRADWFSVLALLQLGKKDEAREGLRAILEDPEHYYNEEASQLNAKL